MIVRLPDEESTGFRNISISETRIAGLAIDFRANGRNPFLISLGFQTQALLASQFRFFCSVDHLSQDREEETERLPAQVELSAGVPRFQRETRCIPEWMHLTAENGVSNSLAGLWSELLRASVG